MNILDILLIVIVAFCVIRSWSKGFIREIFSILGIIVGVLVASRYYQLLFPYVSRYISDDAFISLLSFTLVFLGTFIIVAVLGMLVKALVRIMFVGWVDHTMGGIFGFVKGLLFISLLIWILTTFLPKGSSLLRDSRFSPYIARASRIFVVMTPPKLKDVFNEKQKEMRKLWDETSS